MNEPIVMSRRTFLKKSIALLGAGMVVGTYPVFIERSWYEINEVQLPVRNLPPAFEGWKIVQFSDVHYGFHFGENELKRLVRIINGLSPDIILFTGDLVQRGYQYPDRMIPLLRKLEARGGKWAVTGNHDAETKNEVIKTLHRSDFTVLENDHPAGAHRFVGKSLRSIHGS
jgi:predicted MPP superfamily phosphohydrolase